MVPGQFAFMNSNCSGCFFNLSHRGDGNVLIVSHSLSISALLDTLFEDFELPPDGLDKASVTVTVINYKDGEFSLGKISDLSYVEEGEE